MRNTESEIMCEVRIKTEKKMQRNRNSDNFKYTFKRKTLPITY